MFKLKFNTGYCFFLLIFCIGLFFRLKLYFLNLSFHCDEANLALNLISRSYPELFQPLERLQVAPPFFLVLSKIFYQFAFFNFTPRVSDLMLRLIPLVSGIAAIPAFGFLLQRLFKNKFVTAAGMLILALAPSAVLYSCIFKQYSTELLVSILTLILFSKIDLKVRNFKPFLLLGLMPFLSLSSFFVLAAGMGSRYGGLKQLDGLGPNGETIMDYSIYDAINAGFGKLVFVIRKDFEQDFRDKIISKYEGHIPCEMVFQALDALPEGFTCPADRTKPWGTNHAVMMGADVIKEPFAVINCDDFYGRDSFQVMGKFLANLPEGAKNTYSMVGFRVGNTLSESGTVSRGICETNEKNLLTSVVERTKIQRIDGEVKYIDDNGEWTATADTTPVSMNFWGFTPDYFAYSQEFFKTFLSDPKNMENLKSEFFIPLMVDKLINDGTATVEVLDTASKWFGVTYPEDRQSVVDKIQALVDAGEYPAKLF